MKKNKKEIIKALILVIVYFLLILFPPTATAVSIWIFKLSHSLVIQVIGQYAIPIILSIIFYGKEILEQFKYFKDKPLKKIGIAFLYMISIILINALVTVALGNSTDTANQAAVVLMMRMIPLPYMVLLIVVFAPLLEEIVFRRILIKGLSNFMNQKLAMVISVVLFTLAHTRTASDFVVYLPMSVIFAFAYVKSDNNLANTWLIHMLNNGLAVIAVLLV